MAVVLAASLVRGLEAQADLEDYLHMCYHVIVFVLSSVLVLSLRILLIIIIIIIITYSTDVDRCSNPCCSNPHVDRCSNPLPWDPLYFPLKRSAAGALVSLALSPRPREKRATSAREDMSTKEASALYAQSAKEASGNCLGLNLGGFFFFGQRCTSKGI